MGRSGSSRSPRDRDEACWASRGMPWRTPSRSALHRASWSPISAAPTRSWLGVALVDLTGGAEGGGDVEVDPATAAGGNAGAAAVGGAIAAGAIALGVGAAATGGAEGGAPAGSGSGTRMKPYFLWSVGGAFLCITVHATTLPCEVRHHRTGDGGKVSSPAMSASCSWLTRSSASPMTN